MVKKKREAKLKVERCVYVRHDKGRAERAQHNKQGSMEEEDKQLHRRTQMTGHIRMERTIKGALYRIWCGLNRLGDSGVKVM